MAAKNLARQWLANTYIWCGASLAFEYKQMTIYRTRYRGPGDRRWVNAWSETRVTAEFRRAEFEKRFAPKKLNPGKSDIVRFLNAHAGE